MSQLEQDELQTVLTTARRDPALRPRLDGRTPDGPFRIAQIPPAVLACCADEDRRIANPEGPWEFSDVLREDSPPRARLLNACKVSSDIWDITFEKGGFTTQHGRVRARLTEHGWDQRQRLLARLPRSHRELTPRPPIRLVKRRCGILRSGGRSPCIRGGDHMLARDRADEVAPLICARRRSRPRGAIAALAQRQAGSTAETVPSLATSMTRLPNWPGPMTRTRCLPGRSESQPTSWNPATSVQ